MRCGGLRPPHRICFPLRLALPGFVHFPLQRRDVGEGAEQVGVVQAVANHPDVGNLKAHTGVCGRSFVTIQALTEVTLPGPQAFGRPSPTLSFGVPVDGCRGRPTPGTQGPGRTISID